MIKKNEFHWPEITDADLRRKMKLKKADHDEEVIDDLNGTTAWEDAFRRGAQMAAEEEFEGDSNA
jgi:hypothetical protein